MSAFQSQLAAGIGQAMQQMGVMDTYTPANGDAPFRILTLIDNRGFLIEGDAVVLLAADQIDALVQSSDLNRTPATGDQITLVAGNGRTLTLTAALPDGRRNCWEWVDRYQIRVRIHMKVTKVI
jgi:hypothetical protein